MAEKDQDLSNIEEIDVRKKSSILRRSVTEPKFKSSRDKTPSPLFIRRFTVPSTENVDRGSRKSRKYGDGNYQRRTKVRSRLFKQTTVGVLKGYEDPESRPETCLFVSNSEGTRRPTTGSKMYRPTTGDSSMATPDLVATENKNEPVKEVWGTSGRETNQQKSLEMEIEIPDRVSRLSMCSRQCYTSLDVHNMLDYTTQRMNNLFAAKHYDATELDMLRRSSMDSVSPGSKEYSLVIEQLNGENERNNNNNNNDTKMNVKKKSSKKRWNNLKTRFRAKNTLVRNKSARDMHSNAGNISEKDNSKKVQLPKSRGWLIVRENLSKIAEMAPSEYNNKTPMLNIRHIAQLVKAKEFKLLMKRRASFVENGKFRYEEAKADLFSRYPVPTSLDEQTDDVKETPQRMFYRRNFINNDKGY